MRHSKVLMLTKYGRLGASSRMRSFQYLPWLEEAGFEVRIESLLSDDLLRVRYVEGRHRIIALIGAYFNRLRALMSRHRFDLLWIEKEALPWWPLWFELAMLRKVPYVLDYDDAIFHNYDQHKSSLVRRFFGRRLDGLMAQAALVVGGNNYLLQRACDAGAVRTEFLPTVIDLRHYQLHAAARGDETSYDDKLPRIVWIGSPSTVSYLRLLAAPLQSLSKSHPFVLRIIGGGEINLPGVQTEILPWSEDSEFEDISKADVGIMPLKDSFWERGKCGYKIIQYMASGLPVVASGVGVNLEIVREGENGYIANSDSEWIAALGKLLEDPLLRMKMGRTGRRRVEEDYCIQKTAPRVVELLNSTLNSIDV